MSNKAKVRRKKYITENFQLRYAVMTVILMLAISIILVGIIYVSTWSMLIDSFEGTEVSPMLGKLLTELNITLFPRILLIVFVGILAIGTIVILVVHRLAGPIYRLKKTLKSIGEGVLPAPIKFRKGDELHDLATATNKMLTGLKTMQASNSQLVEEAVSSLEKIAEKLRQGKSSSAEVLQAVDGLIKSIKEFKFLS
jgi:methyl-accepting chemotaxis protein